MKKYQKYDWAALIELFEASGLSQAAFCAEQDINAGYFSQGRKRYLSANASVNGGPKGSSGHSAHPGFTQLNLSAECLPSVSVQVGRCCVQCPAGMDLESVAQLIERLA